VIAMLINEWILNKEINCKKLELLILCAAPFDAGFFLNE
jgi:hypothetical protein